MWGGNPVSFIKDLNIAETWSNYTYSYLNNFLGDVHKNEFTVWNSAYLHRETTAEDLEIDGNDMQKISANIMRGVVKTYA